MKCLNENCLLNECQSCGSVFVANGNASCESKFKVTKKRTQLHFKARFNPLMLPVEKNVIIPKVYR